MSQDHHIRIKGVLTRLFPKKWVATMAREVGAVIRDRKIDVILLFWSLILGFGASCTRNVAGTRRAYELASGKTIAPSSFHNRFSKSFVKFLRAALLKAVEATGKTVARSLQGVWGHFRDILIADCTVVRLHRLLEKAFKGCRAPAGAKIHVVMSVKACGASTVKISDERTKETRKLAIGSNIEGKLLLVDLGYYWFNLFSRIDRNGGFFISRLKKNANFLILEEHMQWRGKAIPLVGCLLKDVLGRLKREILDVEVALPVRHRVYRGFQRVEMKRFRLVGVTDEKTSTYHLYLTNIPSGQLSPEDISRTYAARWSVEILFKELKSCFRLDEILSRKEEVVEAFLLAALITLAVSRALFQSLKECLAVPLLRLPFLRFSTVLRTFSAKILDQFVRGTKREWQNLEHILFHEIVDPNIRRKKRRLLEGICA